MGEIRVRTKWLKSDFDGCDCCEGPHVYGRRGEILASDFPSRYRGLNDDLAAHVARALASAPEGAEVRITFEQIGP